jgi:hypothetical protein
MSVFHVVVWNFEKEDATLFLHFIENCYIHTFTCCVFEVNMNFKSPLWFRFGIGFHLFQKLYISLKTIISAAVEVVFFA